MDDAVFGGAHDEYRYLLTRSLTTGLDRRVVWVMNNPSRATAVIDSPTMRKVRRFTEHFGCRHLSVLNLFALRAPDPARLLRHPDPVGPENDYWFDKTLNDPDVVDVVFAWGAWVYSRRFAPLATAVDELVREHAFEPVCLGYTKGGAPRHPLYAEWQAPVPWTSDARTGR